MSNKISRRAFLKCAGVSAAAVGSASLLSGCKTNGNNTTVNDVKVGDTVKKGDVILIIESMKLMNEVQSDFDGVVKEILVQNGDGVEYDQPLMIIA